MSTGKPTRATKGFAWNHLYKLSEYGLFNLYSILVVRHLGPEAAGPFTVYLSVFSTLSILSAFAVDGTLLRFTGLVESGASLDLPGYVPGRLRTLLRPLLELRLLVSLLLAAVVVLVLLVLPLIKPELGNAFGSLPQLAAFLAMSLVLQALIAFCTSALIGLLETKRLLLGSLIARGLLLTVSLILLSAGGLTVFTAALVHCVSLFFGALILCVILWRLTKGEQSPSVDRFSWATNKSVFAAFFGSGVIGYGIATWGTDLLSMVLSRQPDILMLGAFFGEKSVQISYYHSASVVLLLSEYLFLFGFGGALVSVFSSLGHADVEDPGFISTGYTRLLSARRKVANFQSAATIPFLTFVGVFAGPIVETLFGRPFLPAVTLVQIGVVIVGLTVSLLGGGMSVTSLVAIGRQKTVFRIRLVCGLLNLPLNVALIAKFGALGAVLGTQLCNTAACAVEAFYSTKLIGPAIDYPSVMTVYAVSLGSTLLAFIVCSSMGTSFWHPLFTVLFAGLLTTACVMCSYHFFRVRAAQDALQRVYQLLHSRKATIAGEGFSA